METKIEKRTFGTHGYFRPLHAGLSISISGDGPWGSKVGYIVPEYFRWPGYLSPEKGIKFADMPHGIAAISKAAQWQGRSTTWRSVLWVFWVMSYLTPWPRLGNSFMGGPGYHHLPTLLFDGGRFELDRIMKCMIRIYLT